MKLSIVTSLYCSSGYIKEFYNRASLCAQRITTDYELIFVDDCSPDNSAAIIKNIITNDNKVRLIELAFNVGAAKARQAGLRYATGDYIFMQDADLEEQPEVLLDFYELMVSDENKLDAVFGFLEKRKGGWFERISGKIYYRLLFELGGINSYQSPASSRLMTKDFVKVFLQYTEFHFFEFGIMRMMGFYTKDKIITKTSKGSSTWSLKRKFALAADSILSFSSKSLYLISIFGFGISFLSFLYILYLIVQKLFFSIQVGYVSIIASTFLMGGVILFSLGIIGLYISKIFIQVKNRPNYVIRKGYNVNI